MKDYIMVNFSGGKDSTAMLLHMIELQEQIDEVMFCDTFKEFPAMYKHIEQIKALVEKQGIKFTTLRSKYTFDEWMFEYRPKRRNPEQFIEKYGDVPGKSWATSRGRWCTGYLKIKVIDQYLKELSKEYNVIRCIGIAADETKRLERENQQQENTRHPLVEWGWSEQECLEYCYSKGYDWEGLYNYFDRVSCWCCPLQSLESLRTLYKNFPDLWEELKDMDRRTWQRFKADYSVEELEERFKFEEKWRENRKESLRSRAFFSELKQYLLNLKEQNN